MKVVRFEKDRYLLSFDGSYITQEQLERLQEYWKDWWAAGADPAAPFIFGGETAEFEDHIPTQAERLDEIEEKLDKLLDMLS